MNYESDMALIASTIEKYGSWQEAQKAIRKNRKSKGEDIDDIPIRSGLLSRCTKL